MLGAIIFAVIGIVLESRLPRLFMGAYDKRITEGYIGVTVTTEEENISVEQPIAGLSENSFNLVVFYELNEF